MLICVNRFLLSGADVISTATYQASVEGFIDHLNVSSERAKELIMSGVQLAKDTVKTFVGKDNDSKRKCDWSADIQHWVKRIKELQFFFLFSLTDETKLNSGCNEGLAEKCSSGQRCPLVAGSLGPYGAFLHNGSEYTGDYAEKMSVQVSLLAFHNSCITCDNRAR